MVRSPLGHHVLWIWTWVSNLDENTLTGSFGTLHRVPTFRLAFRWNIYTMHIAEMSSIILLLGELLSSAELAKWAPQSSCWVNAVLVNTSEYWAGINLVVLVNTSEYCVKRNNLVVGEWLVATHISVSKDGSRPSCETQTVTSEQTNNRTNKQANT